MCDCKDTCAAESIAPVIHIALLVKQDRNLQQEHTVKSLGGKGRSVSFCQSMRLISEAAAAMAPAGLGVDGNRPRKSSTKSKSAAESIWVTSSDASWNSKQQLVRRKPNQSAKLLHWEGHSNVSH